MQLTEFFPASNIVRDYQFSRLGYVDARYPEVLAYADSLKYCQKAAANSNVSCLIVTPELSESAGSTPGLVVAQSPRQAFYDVHTRILNEGPGDRPFTAGRGTNCKIHPSAIVSDGCQLGDNVVIGEQVVVRDPVQIGSDVTIEAGVRIGVEGILYHRTKAGNVLIPHAGYVRIHDGASLMTNSVVVRSVHDTDLTEVGRGSVIGLGSIVGHEARVGDAVVVSNQCVLARRCVVGNNAFIGTSVVLREHVHIGENAQVMAGSVVIDDVADNASVSGNFATEHKIRMLDFTRARTRR